jgi:hypothetical protein
MVIKAETAQHATNGLDNRRANLSEQEKDIKPAKGKSK